jgi:hypothetical protein
MRAEFLLEGTGSCDRFQITCCLGGGGGDVPADQFDFKWTLAYTPLHLCMVHMDIQFRLARAGVPERSY